jgi:hypothetical protein
MTAFFHIIQFYIVWATDVIKYINNMYITGPMALLYMQMY